MPKNQKGFGAVETLILILTATVIAIVGWYSLRHNQQDKSTQQSASNNFEYVSYNNNIGQKYKLKFYTQYKVTKSPIAENTSSPSESSAKGLGLGSEVSNNGYLPIWLAIASKDLSSFDETDKAQVENGKNCRSNGFSKAFTVYNSFTDQTINVCNVSSSDGNKKAAYIALFTYNDQLNVITIAANKKTKTGDLVASTDLASYDKDLKTIISSIEVVED